MSENFEQSVKNILDDVQFVPHDEVWQNVRHAMKPEEKKRRIIFWWIIPFVLTGGVFLYLLINNRDLEQEAENSIKINQGNSPVNQGNKEVAKNNSQKVNEHESFSGRSEPFIPLVTEVKVFSPGKTPGTQAILATKNVTGDNEIDRSSYSVAIKDSSTYDAATTDKNEITAAGIDEKNETLIDSLKNDRVTDTVILSKAGNAATVQQKQSGEKWKIGLTADIGISNKVKNIVESNASTSRVSFSNVTTGTSSGVSGSPVYQKSTTTGKMLWGIGFSAQKNFRKRMSFQFSAGYQHQQFSSITSTYSNPALTVMLEKELRKYDLHFLNVYSGFSMKLVQFEDMKFSMGGGIDNHVLLAAKYDQNKFVFSSGQSLYQTVKSPGDYKTWQPHIRMQLLAEIFSSKHNMLQLSPYLRYGIRSFENQTGNKNHLMSFGLTTTYFLK